MPIQINFDFTQSQKRKKEEEKRRKIAEFFRKVNSLPVEEQSLANLISIATTVGVDDPQSVVAGYLQLKRGEQLLNQSMMPRSASQTPQVPVDPFILDLLKRTGFPTENLTQPALGKIGPEGRPATLQDISNLIRRPLPQSILKGFPRQIKPSATVPSSVVTQAAEALTRQPPPLQVLRNIVVGPEGQVATFVETGPRTGKFKPFAGGVKGPETQINFGKKLDDFIPPKDLADLYVYNQDTDSFLRLPPGLHTWRSALEQGAIFINPKDIQALDAVQQSKKTADVLYSLAKRFITAETPSEALFQWGKNTWNALTKQDPYASTYVDMKNALAGQLKRFGGESASRLSDFDIQRIVSSLYKLRDTVQIRELKRQIVTDIITTLDRIMKNRILGRPTIQLELQKDKLIKRLEQIDKVSKGKGEMTLEEYKRKLLDKISGTSTIEGVQ